MYGVPPGSNVIAAGGGGEERRLNVRAQLGWIGMGNIGTPMVLRLIAAGHDVGVWGRNKTRLAPALAAGASEAASPAELAANSDAVFLCVLDTAAVEEVVFGADGVAAGLRPGSHLVDHSTIHPERTRAFALRLHERCRAHWVDAPVSGGPGGATAGTLSAFVGGAPESAAQVRPWLAAYARNVTHLGDSGSGQAAKSCNQAVVCGTLALWAEVLAYARRSGLEPEALVDALAGGWADSTLRDALAPAMARGEPSIASLGIFLKDLTIIADVARGNGSPMFLAPLVAALFALGERRGAGGLAGLLEVFENS